MVSFVWTFNLKSPPLFLGGRVAARFESPRATSRAQLELASPRIGPRLGHIPASVQRALASWGPHPELAQQFVRKQAPGSRASSVLKAGRCGARSCPAGEAYLARPWASPSCSWAEFDSLLRSGAAIHSLAPAACAGEGEPPLISGPLKWVRVGRLNPGHSISVAKFTGAQSSKKGTTRS